MNKERETVLLQAIEQGLPLKHAAKLAGISYDTLNRWKTRGSSEFAPDEFRKFCVAVEHSEAVAMQINLARIQAAGEKDWRAAAWILERRHPEEFGAPQRNDSRKPDQTPRWLQHGGDEPEVLTRMKQQAGVRELAGMLGTIVTEKLERKKKEERMAQIKGSVRLRE